MVARQLFGRLGRPPPEIIFVPLCLPLIHDTVPSARVEIFKLLEGSVVLELDGRSPQMMAGQLLRLNPAAIHQAPYPSIKTASGMPIPIAVRLR
jgi:hypothetical protein